MCGGGGGGLVSFTTLRSYLLEYLVQRHTRLYVFLQWHRLLTNASEKDELISVSVSISIAATVCVLFLCLCLQINAVPLIFNCKGLTKGGNRQPHMLG